LSLFILNPPFDLQATRSSASCDLKAITSRLLRSNPPARDFFINITDKNEVDVVDRKAMQITARWPIGVAQTNSPMAYERVHHRLIIAAGIPECCGDGFGHSKVVAKLPAAGRQMTSRSIVSGRIYVPGGDDNFCPSTGRRPKNIPLSLMSRRRRERRRL